MDEKRYQTQKEMLEALKLQMGQTGMKARTALEAFQELVEREMKLGQAEVAARAKHMKEVADIRAAMELESTPVIVESVQLDIPEGW